MQEPSDFSLPTRLGDFECRRLLGAGGSGEVFEASWGPRHVALKVLRSDLLATDAERHRFFSEARILAELGHPGIVKILSFGVLDDGRPYLAMELLDGEPLAVRANAGTIGGALALSLFRQIAEAVAAIHQRGLIHRDIKPENVLVVRDTYAVLLDFGIAKSLDAPASTTTQEGNVRGTPAYMAPERFFGQSASVASDVYELGVLLYVMLTASLPWDSGLDPEARLNPKRPSGRGADVGAELESVLMRALSTRPEARFPSVVDLLEAVETAAGSAQEGAAARTTVALSSGPAAKVIDSSRSPPPSAAQTSPTAKGKNTRQPRQSVTAASPSRGRVGLAIGIGVGVCLVGAAVALALLTKNVPANSAAIVTEPAGDSAERARATGESETSEAVESDRKIEPTPTRVGDDSGLETAARHHPSDTVVLMGLRGRELRQSAAFATVFNAEKTREPLLVIVRALEPCGIDIFDDLDWMTVGVAAGGRQSADVILAGAFDRETVESCIAKVGSSLGAGSKLAREGAVTTLDDGSAVAGMVWLTDSSFLVSTRKSADSAWLAARARGTDSAADQSPIAAELARLDRSSTFWIAGVGDELDVGKELEGVPMPLKLAGQVSVSARMSLRASLDYQAEDAGKAAEEVISKRFADLKADPMFALVVDKLEVTRHESVLELEIGVGEAGTKIVSAAIVSALKDAK